jgi:histidinol-phosphate aminotransferase
MEHGQTSFRITDAARPAVVDRELTRPDWTSGAPRDQGQLWLDKNENTDPDLASVTSRLVADVLAGPGSRWLSTYPDSASLYRKLAVHVGCTARQLMLTAGSDGAIRAVFEAFVNPGDTIVHTFPTFAMYPVYARMYGAKVVRLGYTRTAAGPSLSPDQVVAAVSQTRPKLLCLPNPDSPTGTVFPPDQLRRIVDTCARVGAVMLVDEAYHPFYQPTVADWTATLPHLIVARTFAKAWGLAGLRIGYAIAHEDTAAILHKVRPMYEVNTVAVAVMERMLDQVDEMRASGARLNAGRDGFLDAMDALALPTVRAKGNFLHVSFGALEADVNRALAPLVLYRRDGGDECLRGYSRFSATTPALFAPLVDRISHVVSAARSGAGANRA